MKLGHTKREDRSRAAKYRSVGRSLYRTAQDLATIGESKYGNGLAIVSIHAAIAYTDALTVAFAEIKSTAGDHLRATDVLQHALARHAEPDQVRRLGAILNAKSHASYSGNYYTLEDGQKLLKEVEAYVAWAEDLLERRPL